MAEIDRATRRLLLRAMAYGPVLALLSRQASATAASAPTAALRRVEPLPLEAVRLTASPYLAAVDANRAYLLALEPDRLLHNFRASAGLQPRGEAYGGWEGESLAGHTLGHYLSACSLMYAQTGDTECKRRVDAIVAELAACQAAHGDGYVAGFTRKRGDTVEDGKAIFPELVSGDIRSQPFNLNGAWSPFYTLHKLLAGLLDAQRYCGNAQALAVALGLSAFLDGVCARLDDAHLQQMLDTEFGGVNESFAELSARTGDRRWLALARRFHHGKVLDPLAAERDELSGLHSNTQVPKLIAEARIYELSGDERSATAARFFWRTVTQRRSYVIGGNSDRENFELPLAQYVTDQTCETCNSYNMLKLTRHLYAWQPDAAWFDYYERAHLNHILAHHDPGTGMFTYMMPMMSGARREFSTPTNDFWCCMGTGMESHAKHGDSIYWQSGDQLYVNLYIASQLDWQAQGAKLALETAYPFSDEVVLKVTALARPRSFALALRMPAWSGDARVSVNGKDAELTHTDGYAILRRKWKAGDSVRLLLPMRLRTEPIADDPDLLAFMHGPLVLAADLGAADAPFDAQAPVLVGAQGENPIAPVTGRAAEYDLASAARPTGLRLAPFFQQYDRRTALYFRRLTPEQWEREQTAYAAERKRVQALDAQAVDIVRLGQAQAESDHELRGVSEPLHYRGRDSRLARKEGWFEFRMKTADAPLTLQATYGGDERNRRFRILVDGVLIGTQRLDGEHPGTFIERGYPIPVELTRGKDAIVVRFEAEKDYGTGPVYGCRLLAL